MTNITQTDIHILIQHGEGMTREFKGRRSVSFVREVVALTNTLGMKILLGMRDGSAVTSIQDIAHNCDPPVKVLTEPVDGVPRPTSGKAMPGRCSAGTVSSGVRAR